MPVLRVEPDVILKRDPDQPISYQIYDCFEDYFPPDIQKKVRELNVFFPLASLRSQVAERELTEGQWLLYTCVCFSGPTLNGGVEGFFGNCPGLIRDVELLLEYAALDEFLVTYRLAAKPLLNLIEKYRLQSANATGDELKDFWTEFEAEEEKVDLAAIKKIEMFSFENKQVPLEENWLFLLESRVLQFVLNNPSHFQKP